MSTASLGRAREYRARDWLIGQGWVLVARSAASRGVADLIMVHPLHGVALLQIGSASKTLGPADRERFTHAAQLCHALAILAVVIPRRGITYYQINTGLPASWEGWTP